MTLYELLLKNGYPKDEMFNHGSDLYVFKTDLTYKVITAWLKAQNYPWNRMVETFTDNVTGRPMYEIAFQYQPYWNNLLKG